MAAARDEPPRWFKPIVFGAMLVAVGAVGAVVTQLASAPDDPLPAGDRSFVIPGGHRLIADDGRLIRIRRPEDLRDRSRRATTGVM